MAAVKTKEERQKRNAEKEIRPVFNNPEAIEQFEKDNLEPIPSVKEPAILNSTKPPTPAIQTPEPILKAQDVFIDTLLDTSEPIKPNEAKKSFVRLRKISNFNFRLGLERTPEKYKVVPGSSQGFQAFRKGKEYLTGLSVSEEKRLGSILGQSLDKTSDFFLDASFRMEDRIDGQVVILDDSPIGAFNQVMISCMIASPVVANGLHEYTSGIKPHAEWYIENPELEAQKQTEEIDKELKASDIFRSLSEIRKIQISKIVGIKTWGLSPSVITSKLWSFIKQSDATTGKMNNLNLFLKVCTVPDTEVAVRALVEDAIFYNVIVKDRAKDYVYEGEPLGATKDLVVGFLMNPRNSSLRTGIEHRVNMKQG